MSDLITRGDIAGGVNADAIATVIVKTVQIGEQGARPLLVRRGMAIVMLSAALLRKLTAH